MIGSFCYRFKDAAHAAAMIASLDAVSAGGNNYTCDEGALHDHGPLMRNTGTDELPVYEADPGHLVFVLTGDRLGVDGWDPWQFVPDPWPHSFGGREIDQLVSEELAPEAPEVIPDTVPAKLTPEEREARLEARAARLAAYEAIMQARQDREEAKAILDAKNAEIALVPILRAEAVARITSNTAERALLVTDRDAAIAVVQGDGTREEKDAAREQRDSLIEQIAKIDEQLTADRAYRDGSADLLTALRAERDAQRVILDELDIVLAAERAKREAASV